MNLPRSILQLLASAILLAFLPGSLAAQPLLEYRFDNQADFASGLVRDRSGPYPAFLYGGPRQIAGTLGNAIELDGSSDYVDSPFTTAVSFPNGLTLEAFVRRDSNNSEDCVLSKWYGNDQFLLTFYPEGHGKLIFSIRFADLTTGNLTYSVPDSVYLGEWVHVAATYNGSGRLRLFWNGKLVAEDTFASTGMAAGSNPIHVGDAGNSWSRFDGAIDEVKVWQSELSAFELRAPLRPRVFVVEYDSALPALYNPFLISADVISTLTAQSDYVKHEIVGWVNTGTLPPTQSTSVFDYAGMYTAFDFCGMASRGDIHEVWVWAGHEAGLNEWAVNGPWREAFGLGVGMPECDIQMAVMGFNYLHGLSDALESVGHRLEDNFRNYWGIPLWETFDGQYHRYMYTNPAQPPLQEYGAHCGNVHFPPNADQHYEFDSLDWVESNCDDWRSDGSGANAKINCTIWGCTQVGFYNWWLGHMPGPLNTNGPGGSRLQNWWTTIAE